MLSTVPPRTTYPPINFIYAHFHNSIRSELDALASRVRSLEAPGDEAGVEKQLHDLKDRYRFLEQVYKYHSNLEDEVLYPILDSKVRNVTLAYSVEHQDEEFLFDQLLQLLSEALERDDGTRKAIIRTLICKVEEIHTTLRKHLAKEEEQLLPLLIEHFSFAEQAELVAQFLYSIPLETVERVLSQLRPMIPKDEQEQLLEEIRAVIPDNLLSQLLTTWLQPADEMPAAPAEAMPQLKQALQQQQQPVARCPPTGPSRFLECCGNPAACIYGPGAEVQRAAAVPCSSIAAQAPVAVAVAGTLHPPPLEPADSDDAMAGADGDGLQGPPSSSSGSRRAPLQEIIHFHRSICSALEDFAREARSLQHVAEITASQLSSLLERHRFIRSVYVFHSISEEEVLFPEVQRLTASRAGGVQAAHQCEKDHQHELSIFEDLGRTLADVRAFARRGRKEVSQMLEKLCSGAEAVHASITHHMEREEADVFPLLEHHLCDAQQRALVYRTIRAMPLRLLERVMPWVVSTLKEDDAAALLSNIRLGAPGSDLALVELLTRWARRGRRDGSESSPQEPAPHDTQGEQYLQCTATCGPRILRERSSVSGTGADDAAEGGAESKRPRLAGGPGGGGGGAAHGHCHGAAGAQMPAGAGSGGSGGADHAGASNTYNPIDHIFQFHKALRQELRQLEADAMSLEHAMLGRVQQQQQQNAATEPASASASAASGAADGLVGFPSTSGRGSVLPAVHSLHGRFQFLQYRFAANVLAVAVNRHPRAQGIYRAHSKAEDEIVFPALEAKQALRNVSHAYTLDHRKEEQLFEDLEKVIDDLRVSGVSSAPASSLSEKVMSVRRMCAAIRASLETHIRSEESELWPLFTEHFSIEEQQYLVGVIIGRTGAQVLQALLPWVSETFSSEEKEAMMDSLRAATRNTMFDQWLEAIQAHPSAAVAGAGVGGPQAAQQPLPHHQQPEDYMERPLQQIAEYLGTAPAGSSSEAAGAAAAAGAAGAVGGAPSSASATAADSTAFRPGWEDIFRMNQQQLEAAIHRVSNDPNLEPERKAYLIQNIMVSKYIVAQQRRMQGIKLGDDGARPAGSAAQHDASPAARAAAGAGAANFPSTSAAAAAAAGAAPARPGPQQGGPPQHPQTFHDAAQGILGCKHYQRRCRLVAPCCNEVHTCRLCHDEAADHRMDRYAVSEMVCMVCGTQQPVAGTCGQCASPLARYFCGICHLFDDEPGKDIYHCPFCNVCRRGHGLGVDFFHCMNCNACMSLSLFSSHRCREKCIEGNCPVCHEYLFDSSAPIKELPCGHFMHSSCFLSYTRYNYTCPLCSKSAGDMSVYFQMLDSLLASERLPPEYAGRMQQVLCNDCGKMGFAPFHFVYHACPHCRSYNTRVL